MRARDRDWSVGGGSKEWRYLNETSLMDKDYSTTACLNPVLMQSTREKTL